MPDRLTSLDASFLYLEETTTAMHVGSVMVFEPGPEPDSARFDYDRLVALVSSRIAFVPRYRQRVREVPGHLSNPVWVDDEHFDVTYHVRRSSLPRPGSDEQLEEFVARIQPRVLDRRRPLWEVYLVEGLADGRFALVTKAHQALVDGEHTVDIGQLILDDLPLRSRAEPVGSTPDPMDAGAEMWEPSRGPGDLELVAGALIEAVRRPSQVVDTVRGGLAEVQAVGSRVLSGLGGLAATLARTAARPAPTSPLNAEIGTTRRWVMVGTDLEDYRRVRSEQSRARYTGDVRVNDVVLATVAGGLRTWLLSRGEALTTGTTVRAMVPVSVYDPVVSGSVQGAAADEAGEGGTEGEGADGTGIDGRGAERPPAGAGQDGAAIGAVARVTACFVDLPVGEPSPSMRLHRIAFSMRQQLDTGRMIGAESIAGVAGFAPPTLHALGARLGSAMSRRMFNLVVTNVPGPQQPRYVGDARMLSTYPVMPLALGQALSIGLTSYDGRVYFGLNADRDAMPDIDVLGQCLVDALAELGQARPGTQEAGR